MANPIVEGGFGHADPNEAPIKINDLIDLLNSLGHWEIQGGEFRPFVISTAEPGVDDRDKVWIQLDSGRRPIAQKIWYLGASGGAWRRIYNGMQGEIRGYTGNPNIDFDTTGKGKIGLIYDGWQLCNGQNGAPDLSDKFILAGHMNNVDSPGYNNGWQSLIDDKLQKSGGSVSITLTEDTTYRKPTPIITVDRWEAEVNTPDPAEGDLWGEGRDPQDEEGDFTLLPADEGNVEPDPITVLPPFIVMGLITFQGYS